MRRAAKLSSTNVSACAFCEFLSTRILLITEGHRAPPDVDSLPRVVVALFSCASSGHPCLYMSWNRYSCLVISASIISVVLYSCVGGIAPSSPSPLDIVAPRRRTTLQRIQLALLSEIQYAPNSLSQAELTATHSVKMVFRMSSFACPGGR